ncbi:mitochondrial import inner membrane translocase subunit TIM16 [Nowakowskiella sp. JEL0407]|nr:mitochondrial import inner membrane translocase subunit TIM16 [Nowakowskiella sp. JEL0407]
MSARVLTQILVVGVQIVGRAFVEAYKQAASQAPQAIAAGADAATRKTGMAADEALKILNVQKDTSLKEIIERFETLHKANDPKIGGSFYIQSKVVRARERLELELMKQGRHNEESENNDSKNPS